MPPNLSPCIRYPVHHYNLKYTAIWEGVGNNAVCNQEKNMGRGLTIALFSSIGSDIPIAMAEKDIWPEKKRKKKKRIPEGAGGRQRKLLNSVFEKTLLVYHRKEGCTALNHKSLSRLCQIPSTLQALERNRDSFVWFPFLER